MGAAAAVLAPAGPGALVPLKMAISSADSVGNDVYVAVVVDFGNGSSMTTVSKCVPVASNGRDSDALAAAVGSSNVSYAGSGLLCAIDIYPANGVQNCGQSVGNGDYDFVGQKYWHGTSGQWSYSNNGPAGQSVSNPPDDVEGWKFQIDEPASSSGLRRRVWHPPYAQICNASTEVPPPQTPANPVTTTMAPPSAAPSSTPTTASTPAGPRAAAPTSSAISTRSKSGGPLSATTTTTTTAASGATTTTSVSGGSRGPDGGSRGSSDARRTSPTPVRRPTGSSAAGSSSDPIPGVLVGVVVIALAAFALVRWRRRPAEE